MKIGIWATATALIVLGWFGFHFYNVRQQDNRKHLLHAEIASLRAYSEAFALRHGYYMLAPDSCQNPNDSSWESLGRAAPLSKLGCFRIESPDARYAGQSSAPTMQIIGELALDSIRGVEGNDDSKPTWTALQP